MRTESEKAEVSKLLDAHPDFRLEDGAYFTFSVDFELAWGLVNTNPQLLTTLRKLPGAARDPTDFLIRALEKNEVPCTWAVVGHLLLDSCEREDGIPHKGMPRPTPEWFHPDPCTNVDKNPFFYARDVVEEISSSSVQHEIACHSFSHVDFSQCSKDIARAEIETSREIARELGITFKSFVYPRNRVAHVDLLRESGFRVYRGREIWRPETGRERATLLSTKHRILPSPTSPERSEGIWEIPTCLHFSCLGRPAARLPLNALWQARTGTREAIKSHRVFSVYLHPWELALYPSLRKGVEILLRHVSRIRDQGRISIVTLGELSGILDRTFAEGQ
ncbi:MAG: polysaccharide deacetylase family protein [Thermoplasmata archaeon]|nr:polysaccharide deacetylase family protein [Thermoplasmata archaeon]